MQIMCVGLKGISQNEDVSRIVDNVSDLDTAVNLLKICFMDEDKVPYNLVILGGNISSLPETRDILFIYDKQKQLEIYNALKMASPVTSVIFMKGRE